MKNSVVLAILMVLGIQFQKTESSNFNSELRKMATDIAVMAVWTSGGIGSYQLYNYDPKIFLYTLLGIILPFTYNIGEFIANPDPAPKIKFPQETDEEFNYRIRWKERVEEKYGLLKPLGRIGGIISLALVIKRLINKQSCA